MCFWIETLLLARSICGYCQVFMYPANFLLLRGDVGNFLVAKYPEAIHPALKSSLFNCLAEYKSQLTSKALVSLSF